MERAFLKGCVILFETIFCISCNLGFPGSFSIYSFPKSFIVSVTLIEIFPIINLDKCLFKTGKHNLKF